MTEKCFCEPNLQEKKPFKPYRKSVSTPLLNILQCCIAPCEQSVYYHHEANDIICENEHQFIKNRSCVTHLLMTDNNLANGLNDKAEIDGIFFDFSKAFNKALKSRLLLKIVEHRIQGNKFK